MPRVSAIQPTDEELLARVADGDRDAFGDLYQRYARAVLGLALRRLGDRGRAEDARPGGIRVGLARGAQLQAATAARSRRGSTPSPGTRSPTAGAPEPSRRPSCPTRRPTRTARPSAPSSRWVAYRVHRAMEGLPETERAVLELAYWSGLSQSEIADFLSIPLGTVKTRTRSGLRRLAEELDGEV